MKKLRLASAILLCAVSNGHARDAAFEAADVMFYDKNCAKLPADFVNAKIKEATGGETAEATDRLKEAQDLVQANFDDSQLGMKKYCGYQKSDIKCMLYSYRHGERLQNAETAIDRPLSVSRFYRTDRSQIQACAAAATPTRIPGR
jgi:hypothetical protein